MRIKCRSAQFGWVFWLRSRKWVALISRHRMAEMGEPYTLEGSFEGPHNYLGHLFTRFRCDDFWDDLFALHKILDGIFEGYS